MSLSNLQASAFGALLVAGASGLAVYLAKQDDDVEETAFDGLLAGPPPVVDDDRDASPPG